MNFQGFLQYIYPCSIVPKPTDLNVYSIGFPQYISFMHPLCMLFGPKIIRCILYKYKLRGLLITENPGDDEQGVPSGRWQMAMDIEGTRHTRWIVTVISVWIWDPGKPIWEFWPKTDPSPMDETSLPQWNQNFYPIMYLMVTGAQSHWRISGPTDRLISYFVFSFNY